MRLFFFFSTNKMTYVNNLKNEYEIENVQQKNETTIVNIDSSERAYYFI